MADLVSLAVLEITAFLTVLFAFGDMHDDDLLVGGEGIFAYVIIATSLKLATPAGLEPATYGIRSPRPHPAVSGSDLELARRGHHIPPALWQSPLQGRDQFVMSLAHCQGQG